MDKSSRKKKRIYKHEYNRYSKIFNEYMNDSDNYDYYKDLYDKIYNSYKEKIKLKEVDINVEILRLKSNCGKLDTLSKNINVNLILIALTFFINSITLAISISGINNNYKSICIGVAGMLFLAFIILSVFSDMKKNKGFLCDFALQVIKDIQIEENKKDKLLSRSL